MRTDNIKYLIPEGVSAGIYKITASNGCYLIGSTKNLIKRWSSHFSLLRKNIHENSRLQRVYNKYPNGWKCEVIQNVLPIKNVLLEEEQKHIDIHFGRPKCMNLNSKSNMPPNQKGKKRAPRTVEYLQKQIIAKKGKPWPPARRAAYEAKQLSIVNEAQA